MNIASIMIEAWGERGSRLEARSIKVGEKLNVREAHSQLGDCRLSDWNYQRLVSMIRPIRFGSSQKAFWASKTERQHFAIVEGKVVADFTLLSLFS